MSPTVAEGLFQEIVDLVGPDVAVLDQAELRRVETATFETRRKVPVIFRPKNRDEVRECVFLANRFGLTLYPVSSGKNWGYGSSVPSEDNSALLDLSRMNQIVDFDERLGYVVVEPGVTQRQLHGFLRQRGSRLWMDATGSSPDCSLIGNAVERGFGHTPYGDHFANVCGLEVVLPTGEVIETGFANFPNAKTSSVYRWGVGPSVDGIFSQSNFGIVTRMTIWLMPEPEYFQAYFFQAEGDEALGDFIEALRPLRMDGTLRSTVHLANDYKVLNGIQQVPAGEEIPLSADTMKRYRRELKFGRWNGSGALYGTRKQVAEARRLLRRALRGKVSKIQFLDDRMLRFASRFAGPYRWMTGCDLSRTLELVRPVYGLLKGIPTDATLASAYWRKRQSPPSDPNPDRDRCGLIWCAPVAPAERVAVAALVCIAEGTLLEHGFEPMLSLTMITERSVACVVSISYDREIPGDDQRAMGCYEDLQDRLTSHGYYPYRLGIQSMDLLANRDSYTAFLRSLKRAVDPNNILAPGRYLPGGAAQGVNR